MEQKSTNTIKEDKVRYLLKRPTKLDNKIDTDNFSFTINYILFDKKVKDIFISSFSSFTGNKYNHMNDLYLFYKDNNEIMENISIEYNTDYSKLKFIREDISTNIFFVFDDLLLTNNNDSRYYLVCDEAKLLINFCNYFYDGKFLLNLEKEYEGIYEYLEECWFDLEDKDADSYKNYLIIEKEKSEQVILFLNYLEKEYSYKNKNFLKKEKEFKSFKNKYEYLFDNEVVISICYDKLPFFFITSDMDMIKQYMDDTYQEESPTLILSRNVDNINVPTLSFIEDIEEIFSSMFGFINNNYK